jgi:hypothetical protein
LGHCDHQPPGIFLLAVSFDYPRSLLTRMVSSSSWNRSRNSRSVFHAERFSRDVTKRRDQTPNKLCSSKKYIDTWPPPFLPPHPTQRRMPPLASEEEREYMRRCAPAPSDWLPVRSPSVANVLCSKAVAQFRGET